MRDIVMMLMNIQKIKIMSEKENKDEFGNPKIPENAEAMFKLIAGDIVAIVVKHIPESNELQRSLVFEEIYTKLSTPHPPTDEKKILTFPR